jgi:hypothetical protein
MCVTASLRYDVGSPVTGDDDNCIPLSTVAESNPFGAPVLLTEPGEVFLFGPTVALDPTDSSIRYVAYNSVEGTNVSVSRNAGASWNRIPMMPRVGASNIGDPGLSINSTTREVWHSFLTAPEVACVHDQTSYSDNAIAVTSSNDLGRTWLPATKADVRPYGRGYFVDRPSIAVGASILLTFVAVPAAFEDHHTDIVLTRSADRGQSWATSSVSGTTRNVLRRSPTMTLAPDGTIFVAWFERDSAETHSGSIWVARSTDGGATFAEQMVSDKLFAREDGPTISLSEGGKIAYVVFGASSRAGLTPESIYLTVSENEGMTFSPPVRLTQFCGSVWGPASALDTGGNLWVIWYQSMNETSQVAWLRMNTLHMPREAPSVGVLAGSDSPFTMSRSPLVSLGDFLGLASSNGVTVATWTSLRHLPSGGAVYTSSAGDRFGR